VVGPAGVRIASAHRSALSRLVRTPRYAAWATGEPPSASRIPPTTLTTGLPGLRHAAGGSRGGRREAVGAARRHRMTGAHPGRTGLAPAAEVAVPGHAGGHDPPRRPAPPRRARRRRARAA